MRTLVLLLALVVAFPVAVPAADTETRTYKCPMQIQWVANWPNKIGDPTFKPPGDDKIKYTTNLRTMVRDGQDIRCAYDFGGISMTYQHTVSRQILKCDAPAGGVMRCEVKKG